MGHGNIYSKENTFIYDRLSSQIFTRIFNKETFVTKAKIQALNIIQEENFFMTSLYDYETMDFWLNDFGPEWKQESKVELALNQGVVVGSRIVDSGVEFYKGIPYALPPVGDLRWKPTQRLSSFSDLDRKILQEDLQFEVQFILV